jgi:hypothetical protein
MKRNEISEYVKSLLADMRDARFSESNRTMLITLISVRIHRKYPNTMRELRRAIAARYIELERKKRGIK